jgi:hypothetical protein
MRVDDGSAGGDVVASLMCHCDVDEVMVANSSRRVGHAGKPKVGAVGEYRRQQRRFVGSGIAGAQMRKPVG